MKQSDIINALVNGTEAVDKDNDELAGIKARLTTDQGTLSRAKVNGKALVQIHPVVGPFPFGPQAVPSVLIAETNADGFAIVPISGLEDEVPDDALTAAGGSPAAGDAGPGSPGGTAPVTGGTGETGTTGGPLTGGSAPGVTGAVGDGGATSPATGSTSPATGSTGGGGTDTGPGPGDGTTGTSGASGAAGPGPGDPTGVAEVGPTVAAAVRRAVR